MPETHSRTSTSKSTKPDAPQDGCWTFLTNHAHVLVLIAQNPDRVLREIALEVGITERAVQKIVHDLIEANYLQRTKIGRRNHYRIQRRKRLRHPVESHRTVDDLLKMGEPSRSDK